MLLAESTRLLSLLLRKERGTLTPRARPSKAEFVDGSLLILPSLFRIQTSEKPVNVGCFGSRIWEEQARP